MELQEKQYVLLSGTTHKTFAYQFLEVEHLIFHLSVILYQRFNIQQRSKGNAPRPRRWEGPSQKSYQRAPLLYDPECSRYPGEGWFVGFWLRMSSFKSFTAVFSVFIIMNFTCCFKHKTCVFSLYSPGQPHPYY